MALICPGGSTLRVRLHKWRGVKFKARAWVGQHVILETSYPERIIIGPNVTIGIRTVIIAHHNAVEDFSDVHVRIGKDVFIGPNCTILPGVSIGNGAVVAAGSVVNRNVKPFTFVRGNPIHNEAKITVPLGLFGDFVAFSRGLTPLKRFRKKSEIECKERNYSQTKKK